MSDSDRDRWNDKYRGRGLPDGAGPDAWLRVQVENASRTGLPLTGVALDVACGLGQNAAWLSQRGWQVDAVDISDVGLELAAALARRAGCVGISWIVADLDEFVPLTAHYDLVAVFRFLDRRRLPPIIENALKPGGILVYETFSEQHLSRPDSHLRSSQFALQSGELPLLFPGLTVLAYEETELPDRNVARLLARKPCHE